jgi:hypothetical protein
MLARFQQGKQSVWTPTAKGGWSQMQFRLGQKPRAKALPTYLFFAERKGKPKETNTTISIFKEVIL